MFTSLKETREYFEVSEKIGLDLDNEKKYDEKLIYSPQE